MASTASIHKNRRTTLGRINRFISKDTNFSSSANQIISKGCNLFSRLYSDSAPLTSIEHWALPGPCGSWKTYSFNEIKNQAFVPANIGDSFGPTWSTHWFKISVEIPRDWSGKEIHFRWNSQSEATLWDDTGNILQVCFRNSKKLFTNPAGHSISKCSRNDATLLGCKDFSKEAGNFFPERLDEYITGSHYELLPQDGLSPGFREEFVISKTWEPVHSLLSFYVEMACNGMFGAAKGKSLCIDAPDPLLQFVLEKADVAVFESDCFKLLTDLEILHGLADQLADDHRGYQALYCANEMINLISCDNYKKASEMADIFFAEKAGQKAHTLVAMGHCHIDSAWLWTYDESIRKCARSWSAQIRLMEEYPNFKFTCSQAQQFFWIKEWFPSLYAKITQFVRLGNFIPVGGTWVEMDGNIPSGESFIRQFYYGQKYFLEEFGILCKEFWLPDTFGYSAQIPQIIKHCGIDRFLTQKLSWSLVNKFPHHNFWWEGIDGSSVLVHFPPGDSYEMNGKVCEMLKTVNNSQDKGRANVSAYLFGFGDGGGGPTKAMLERLKRAKDVDGLPRVVLGSSDDFFGTLLKEEGKLNKWVGELFLELHNGTYTSQGAIKWYNRKCEFFFREVELLMSIAYCFSKISLDELAMDMAKVDENWKKILLNQFHDVLPGSCIELVTLDAWKLYREVFQDLNSLRQIYHARILGNEMGTNNVLYNPLPWNIRTVVFNHNAKTEGSPNTNMQRVILNEKPFENQEQGNYKIPNEFMASLVHLSASGYTSLESLDPLAHVQYTSNESSGQFWNGILRVEVNLKGIPREKVYFKDRNGDEFEVYSTTTGTSPGMFYLYEDVPLFWDAWDCMDYHLETRRELPYISESGTGEFEYICCGPIVGVYKWTCRFGNGSCIERYTILRAESSMVEYFVVVDWKEDHKFLKVEFPVDILSRDATFEIQYGHVKRPTHMNTSWDMARFEVCGHKWMDISQADKGVTIITDSKYGWHVRDNIVKLSLLRSPKSPDAHCDIHKHYIHYAVLPHVGTFQEAEVIRRAYELNFFGANNVPIMSTNVNPSKLVNDFITSSSPAVVIEAVKVSGDARQTICVRMYEAFGGSALTEIQLGFQSSKVEECDGLERKINTVSDEPCVKFNARFKPFQIRSFLVYF